MPELIDEINDLARQLAEKLDRVRRMVAADREQRRLFEEFKLPELKGLEFVANRVCVHWLCHSPDCKGHKMQVLDWEAIQLQRNVGDQKALQKIRDICDVRMYSLKFFLSNTHAHQDAFSIVGFWYPKKVAQQSLF
jgi:hypothetical protein